MTVENVGGPLFFPAKDGYRKSLFNKDGGHYNIFKPHDGDKAMEILRALFPDGEANDLNFVLFSTSGCHGTYATIEEAWAKTQEPDEDGEVRSCADVTFLLVQPRLVAMTFGNVAFRTREDFEFLKRLRESSWKVVQTIGQG